MFYGPNQMDLVPVLLVRLIRVVMEWLTHEKFHQMRNGYCWEILWLSHVSEDLVSRGTDLPFLLTVFAWMFV